METQEKLDHNNVQGRGLAGNRAGTHVEVLAPAGDAERLAAALLYGADAVYLAGKSYGMRSAPANFSPEELEAAVRTAHEKQVRVYLACNTLPGNDQLRGLPAFLEHAAAARVDGLIISDLGVLRLAKRHAPGVDIHISTQAGVINYEAARMFHELGASRVVLAREISLDEIAELRAKTPAALELEAFVHGAMCVSFSGRCLLSSYLTGRDANRGDCAQPCRWKYALVEEKRPGQYYPVSEAAEGTYIMNAKDLCMIEHIPELLRAGVSSLKIEGRAKSAYYVAVITNAYRCAVDEYISCPDPDHYRVSDWITAETRAISHRGYTTGFYLGGPPEQAVDSGGYIRGYDVVAVVEGYEDGQLLLSQRNRFFVGERVEILSPGEKPVFFRIPEMFNAADESIEAAPHPMMTVKVPFARRLVKGALLRRKNE